MNLHGIYAYKISPSGCISEMFLRPYTTREVELKPGQRFPQERDEMIVYRDNLFFDEEYINEFIATGAQEKTCLPGGIFCG